jgi:redox-sensing transcriptional repressor
MVEEMSTRNARIPQPTIERLSTYIKCLRAMQKDGTKTASSADIAAVTGINAAQFRKDLSYFGEFGTPGRGYDVEQLQTHLSNIMGLREHHHVLLVGAGNLGSALAGYPGFKERGFEIVAVFDNDPAKIGRKIGELEVMDVDTLPKVNAKLNADVGIVAVPASAAQAVVDRLVAGGVKAILNFAPATPQVRPGIVVRNVDLTSELEVLSYYLQH